MTAGALLFEDHTFQNGGPSSLMGAILNLWYHGPTDPQFRNAETTLDIVRELPGGQADILFCSTKCVGSFFDRIVHELNNRIELAQRDFEAAKRG